MQNLYFLDYIAIQKIELKKVKSIINYNYGPKISGCDLVGGENMKCQEHMRKNKFVAGFATGIVSKKKN